MQQRPALGPGDGVIAHGVRVAENRGGDGAAQINVEPSVASVRRVEIPKSREARVDGADQFAALPHGPESVVLQRRAGHRLEFRDAILEAFDLRILTAAVPAAARDEREGRDSNAGRCG